MALSILGTLLPEKRLEKRKMGPARVALLMACVLCFLHVSAAPEPEAQEGRGAACSSGGASVVELIQKKRDGGELSSQEIWEVVSGFHEVRVSSP
jgi:hypothetical protein